MILFAVGLLQACSNGNNNSNDTVAEEPVTEDPVTEDPDVRLSGSIEGHAVTVVKLRGKTNHFGRDKDLQYIDYHATVPDTRVWIAEYPGTRELDIQTDETGW